ncbi:hypothetical protein A2Z00_03140 [Candidatus Gottesmanbacteria bacterium RBG_13_45_10]|uniref:HAD family hydrolase n=1 Tax=Candidatus Gottesmanbacteria bacterium RBG_13_45_10 TaxID=1798370 RepID=A0A1F5ZFY7_9BACT|nr:MAG: hypothetical protein A2Z00_03140 [Candidatus Gottesmanbacteria bacterium RBG_13_45_10]
MNTNEAIYERKETILPQPKAIIFDLDGTLVDVAQFYADVYTGTLVELVRSVKGEEGVKTLWERERLDGKGELTLMAIGIPFRAWAQKLIDAPLGFVTPRPDIVASIRAISARKVIFTGSPVGMAYRVLDRMGFAPRSDFDLIIGWKEPELFPLKWNNSSFVFESVTALFDCDPKEVWSVGDSWETDLEPAKRLGITTIQIRKTIGSPDFRFPDIETLFSTFQTQQP